MLSNAGAGAPGDGDEPQPNPSHSDTSSTLDPTALRVPVIDRDADSLTIALALAAPGAPAGFYVLPTRAANPRHPGSLLGKGWPQHSSRDADQLVAWFAGTDHRVAIHCGRSGVVAFDVDHFDDLTEPVYKAITGEGAPFHATRLDPDADDFDPQRGHYLFAVPPGRRLTNSNGELGRGWGEVRGNNGIILVGGPGREFVQTGVVPVLPDYCADLLPDGVDRSSAVSDTEVARFVKTFAGETSPARLIEILGAYQRLAREGSRHQALVAAACWAVREIVKGRLAARTTLRRLADEFTASMTTAPRPGDRTLPRAAAESEARTVIGWAVAQEWTVVDGTAGLVHPSLAPDARLSSLGSSTSGTAGLRNAGDPHDPHEPAPDPHAQVTAGETAGPADPDPVLDPAAQAQAAADAERFEYRLRERRIDAAVVERLASERRRPLARLSASAFLAAPQPTYLVPGMLYADTLAVCFGPPGAAKTFFVLDLALCLASGRRWRAHGGEPGVSLPRTRVHYLMAEGQAVNVGRTWAWLTHHDVDATELDDWFVAYPEPVELTVEGVGQYLRDVERDRPGLIVLDTKHAMMAGDESKAADVKVMRDALDAIRRVCGSTVLLVDHTGLSDLDRVRGSGSQKAMVATELRVVDDGGIRTATMTRNTAGEVKGQWSFELHQVPDAPRPPGTDVPVVPVPVDAASHPFALHSDTWHRPDQPDLPTDIVTYGGRGKAAVLPLARFMRHSASEGIGHTLAEARRALWTVLRDERGKPIHSEDTITRAWGALVHLGRLAVVEGNQSTSRSKWLERPGDPSADGPRTPRPTPPESADRGDPHEPARPARAGQGTRTESDISVTGE